MLVKAWPGESCKADAVLQLAIMGLVDRSEPEALSCANIMHEPNFTSSGPIMEVRVIRDVKKGEQLTVSYVNMTEPRKIRTVELLATKHFICHCERCTEPIEGTPDMMLEVRIQKYSFHFRNLHLSVLTQRQVRTHANKFFICHCECCAEPMEGALT